MLKMIDWDMKGGGGESLVKDVGLEEMVALT